MNPLNLNLASTFTQELPADPIEGNPERRVIGAAFSYVNPTPPSAPELIHVSAEVAKLVGLSEAAIKSGEFLRVFSGAKLLEGVRPYAMNYGGHQFGNWAGQLGDGRAINLAEVNHGGKHWALQLKGAGKTPYSRRADGLAVLRSSIREHLCSEAMFHLGVPSSRSLSLVLTGEQVLRDVMYDGNPAYEKGAVVCRVARNFIRFGSFEIHLANQDIDTLRKLADYTIRHFYPEIEEEGSGKYGEFFQKVCSRSLDMVIHWQRVGFVHGVMNTDNMSILGDTIDYGPYGWLEGYDPNWTPNTTDSAQGRYRFGNQPSIIFWNLHKLANALYPLVEKEAPFQQALEAFRNGFAQQFLEMRRAKLGLAFVLEGDEQLIEELDEALQLSETDMTIFFRQLSHYQKEQEYARGIAMLEPVQAAFYDQDEINGEIAEKWSSWLNKYLRRLRKEKETDAERKAAMDLVNPKYVLRNYMAQLAIDAADKGDYSLIDELYTLLQNPYEEQPEMEKWYARRPEWARNKVGCSMLSCSS